MKVHKFIIPYQYTIIAHAEVWAASLEEAVEIVESDSPCPEPSDILNLEYTPNEIHSVKFSYLECSHEVHHEDLDIYNHQGKCGCCKE